SGEAFGIHQRLLALVIGRSEMQVGPGDLDVIAEDGVELHFERLDADPLAFPLFDVRDVALAVVAEIAQLIEFLIDSIANDAAISEAQRRLGDDGALDLRTQIREFVEQMVELYQTLSFELRERAVNPGQA